MSYTIPTLSIRNNNDVQIGILDYYYEDTLEIYLEGKVSVFSFTALDEDANRENLKVGNQLSFTYNQTDYHLYIVKSEENEDTIKVTAYALVLEYNNETVEAFEATNWSFEQYLAQFDGEHILKIGVNEVSDKRISHKWEGQETVLARFFSLAKLFNAEIEFNTPLNSDGSLKGVVINIYKEHDAQYQGVGANRTGETFLYGDEIETVEKTTDITNLYSVIRPVGKEGLTLEGFTADDVKDEQGNVLYHLQDNWIYAPQTRQQFPSNLLNSKDKWIAYDWVTEYATTASLYGNALAKIKTLSQPQVTWTIRGKVTANVGDTISIQDRGYTPTLFLTARVTEQRVKITNPSENETTFSNVEQVASQISTNLIERMNQLIEESVPFQSTISSTNGVSFKNNEGETSLTIRVTRKLADVTDSMTFKWFKDNNPISTGKSVTVKASTVDNTALYRCDVLNGSNQLVTSSEVTITNVADGATGDNGLTSYVHTAWADSSDGKANFSLTDSLNKKYLGVYSDFVSASSTEPSKYKWTETSNAIDLHTAYANSADGKTDFSRFDTSKNVLDDSLLTNGYVDGATGRDGINNSHTRLKQAIDVQALQAQVSRGTFSNEFKLYSLDSNDNLLSVNVISKDTLFTFPTNTAKFKIELNTSPQSNLHAVSQYGLSIVFINTQSATSLIPQYVGTSTSDSDNPTDYTWQLNSVWLDSHTSNELNNKVDGQQYSNESKALWENLSNYASKEDIDTVTTTANDLLATQQALTNNVSMSAQQILAIDTQVADINKILGNTVVNWQFINTYLRTSNAGLEIGDTQSNLKIVLTKDKISFMDGGNEVAYFSNNTFRINSGTILTELQIGQHKFSKINNNHTTISWIAS